MAVVKKKTQLEKDVEKIDKQANKKSTSKPTNNVANVPSTGNLTVQYEIKISIGPYSHVGCTVEYIDSSLDYECADDIGKRTLSILSALQRATLRNLQNAGIDVVKFVNRNKDSK